MNQQSVSQETRDYVRDAADVVRIVIHREQAYDILDELANNPKLEILVDALSKISRLVTKTLNDLNKLLKNDKVSKDCKDIITDVVNRLQWWFKKQDELYNYLKNVKDMRTEIKRFAAYALAPDNNVVKIGKCEESAR